MRLVAILSMILASATELWAQVEVTASRQGLGVLTAMSGEAPRYLALYEGIACVSIRSSQARAISGGYIRLVLEKHVTVGSRSLTQLAMKAAKTRKARLALGIARVVDIAAPIVLLLAAGNTIKLNQGQAAVLGVGSLAMKLIVEVTQPERDEALKTPGELGTWLSDLPATLVLSPGQCTEPFLFSGLYPGPERVEARIE